MISVGVSSFLRGVPTLAAVVGERIYQEFIPQHVYTEATKLPCLVHQYPGSLRQPRFCSTDPVVEQTLQVDCYARSPLERDELAALVRAALIDYAGLMGDVQVKHVAWASDFPSTDPEPGLFRVSQFYTVWFVE
jgi:hypothetical protein